MEVRYSAVYIRYRIHARSDLNINAQCIYLYHTVLSKNISSNSSRKDRSTTVAQARFYIFQINVIHFFDKIINIHKQIINIHKQIISIIFIILYYCRERDILKDIFSKYVNI